MNQIQIIGASFACGVRDWWVFAGDPLVSGTLFTACYAVTAWLMFRVARLSAGPERTYWRICGWLFVFQCINVNADLQGIAFTFGRCVAHAQGWYENRHPFQIAVLVAGLAIGTLFALAMAIVFYRNIVGNLLLTLGMLTVFGLMASEAVSYHTFDAFFGEDIGPFATKQMIEMSGIAMVLAAALIRLSGVRSHGRLADAPRA